MKIQEYYNQLAPFYHLFYTNWEADIEEQAQALNKVIRDIWGNSITSIFDVACGIGTQSLGLAKLGYSVVGIDVAEVAITRARNEAECRDLSIEFYVGNMHNLGSVAKSRRFDLIIACDNAIPHLLSDEDIREAFKQFYYHTREGGGCILSIRDYDAMQLGGTQFYPRKVHFIDGVRWIVFDVWKFEGQIYEMNTYIIRDNDLLTCETKVLRAWYYCVGISKLKALMQEAGFINVRRIDNCYFQPLLVGSKG